MKINQLFSDVITEDTKYEFKSILNPENPIKWAKTIVAYANGKGGLIFIGVSDNGEAFGLSLEDIDKTKNLITLENNRHILPHAIIKYMLRSVDDNAEKFVLAVKISASDSIVRYKEGDFNETVYIRGDGNSIPASPEEIISLYKRKFGVDNSLTEIAYDESLWTSYTNLCKEFREDKTYPTMKDLQNEEIVSKEGFVKSGFLMFKDDYDDDDTRIHCRLWIGKDKTGQVIDSARFKGPLSIVFMSTLIFIERNTKSGWEKTPEGGRREIRSYPKEAIREVLVNAIAHRDYSISGTQIDVDIYTDRLDVVSPGSWLLPKNYNDYPLGSIPSIRRNTVISACLDLANLMERGGTGFQTIINCYKDSPNEKQPVVMAYPGFLDLRLYDQLFNTDEIVAKEFTEKDLVIELLKTRPRTIKEMQSATKYKSRSGFLDNVINPLINDHIISREGKPKSPNSVFRLLHLSNTGE